VLCATGACGNPAGDDRALAPTAPTATNRGSTNQRMLLTGTLEAVNAEKLVVPRTPSWVIGVRWLAEDGARVKAGDRVAEFDASGQSSALSDKRLAVSRARLDVTSEAARGQGAIGDKAADAERQRAAVDKARIEAATPADLVAVRLHQEKLLALARAEDALAKANEDLATAQRSAALDLRLKEVALSRTTRELGDVERRLGGLVLRAPRDGLVLIGDDPREGRKFRVGSQVWAGFPIATIPDLANTQVRARLSNVDDGAVSPGMRADCILDAYPDRRFAGSIRSVSPVARIEARTQLRFFDVVVALDRTEPDIMLPGLSVRVEVIRNHVSDALPATPQPDAGSGQ